MTKMDPSEVRVYQEIAWITSLITFGATIAFYNSLRKVQKRDQGTNMLVVLNIIDVARAFVTCLAMTASEDDKQTKRYAAVETFIYHLSLYWSTAIAVYLYKAFTHISVYNSRNLWIASSIVCVVLSLLPAIMLLDDSWDVKVQYLALGTYTLNYDFHSTYQKIMFFITYDVIGVFTPFFTSLYFYIKIYLGLKAIYRGTLYQEDARPSRVLWFSLIQALCFGPETILNIFNHLIGTSYAPEWIGVFMTLFHRSWGFLNMLVYWFMGPNSDYAKGDDHLAVDDEAEEEEEDYYTKAQ